MGTFKIVIDTNVLVSALKSNRCASFKLLSLIDQEKFVLNISVSLIFEYEEVLKRNELNIPLSDSDIDNIINYICKIAEKREIFYLWRPYLNDPKDDLILELAVESECDFIITYNTKDFESIDQFGIKAITPKAFLALIGEIK